MSDGSDPRDPTPAPEKTVPTTADCDADAQARHRSLIARIGAYSMHAKHDVRDTTAAGRQKFLDSFERQVDPEGILTAAERRRRAKAARQSHMAKLALRSAQARAARKAGR